MSWTYDLVCMECGEVLSLGKIIRFSSEHDPTPLQFGGWWEGKKVSGADIWPSVQRFLLIHRNHELRILSSYFLEKLDQEGRLRYIWETGDIVERPVEPEPDFELDAEQVPSEIATRLRKLFRTDEEMEADKERDYEERMKRLKAQQESQG